MNKLNETWRTWKLMAPDGGAGAGAGAAAAGDGGGAEAGTVGNAADDAPVNPRARRNPMANVRFGKQPDAGASETQGAGEAGQTAPAEETWEQVRDGKFREQYRADVSAIVQQRLKNSKQAEAQLEKLGPVLNQLYDRYGVEPGNLDALIAKANDDDALYEEEALRRGMPVSALKQIKQLEREQEATRQAQAEAQAQAEFQQHLQKLVMQGESLRATFPNFDLRKELTNPEFARLTSPGVGVDVETAYWVTHRAELEPMAMRVGVQQTAQKISNAIAAGSRRPAENGARSGAGLEIRDDPSKLTRTEREELRRRVRNGEKIEF